MKLLLTICCSTFLFWTSTVNSQEPNLKHTYKWYFGYGAGLDFSSGEPAPLTDGKLMTGEASFVANDDDGNLLFYGHHDTIWNKNHEVMVGGVNYGITQSVTQLQCVKQPGSTSIYYLFHIRWVSPYWNIYYSIIDLNQDNGLGALVSSDLLLQNSSQGIGAVLHCNGEHVWISGKILGSKNLTSWLLTETGLELTPIVSNDVVQISYMENTSVVIIFSPDGTKAAVTYLSGSGTGAWGESSFELYEFDNCTGLFSNAINISHSCIQGINFSPDNTKLYAGSVLDCISFGNAQNNEFVQYDISVFDETTILNSKYVISAGGHTAVMDMRNAPNGRMYVCDIDTTREDYGFYKLGVVNHPNRSGVLCNYLPDTIDLGGYLLPNGFCDQCHIAGLPHFLPHYFNGLESTASLDKHVQQEDIHLYPNPTIDLINITHTYNENMQYRIIDLQGKIYQSGTYHTKTTQLNVQHLPQGMYFIQLESTTNHNIFTFKISKL